MPGPPTRPAVRRKPPAEPPDRLRTPAADLDVVPPEVRAVREVLDVLRQRHRKAVRRKWYADDDAERRLPHPFDEP